MSATVLTGDCLGLLRGMESGTVQCCVTSPPYWGLRDYGHSGQHGLEASPADYVGQLVEVFAEVRRVLRNDGTLWLNLGDSYAVAPGLKPKDLCGIPWRVAFGLQADGWYLRSDIIWHKPACMPESVRDRPTKAHEYVFLLSKSARYFYDAEAIKEPCVSLDEGHASYRPNSAAIASRTGEQRRQIYAGGKHGETVRFYDPSGRNRRTVWTVPTQPYSGAHFATMPPELARLCIAAGSARGDLVLDPYAGAGTTGVVARRLRRSFVGCELNPDYAALARRRIYDDCPLFAGALEDACET